MPNPVPATADPGARVPARGNVVGLVALAVDLRGGDQPCEGNQMFCGTYGRALFLDLVVCSSAARWSRVAIGSAQVSYCKVVSRGVVLPPRADSRHTASPLGQTHPPVPSI